MIVIGVDTHKRTHALAAVDAGTGRVRGQRQIKAEEQGHLAAVRWARGLDGQRVWAIEDCRHVSRRLEQALLAAGERVVRVAPRRMGASRRGEREPGKSDEIDALAGEGVRLSVCEAEATGFVCQSGSRSPKWILRAVSAGVQERADLHFVSARSMAR
jgi:hypothetical protein